MDSGMQSQYPSHPSHHSAPSYDSSSVSSTSSPRTNLPPPSTLYNGPSPRNVTLPPSNSLHSMVLPPTSSLGLGGYGNPYRMSTSPSGSLHEPMPHNDQAMVGAGLAPPQLTPSALSAQKRAYRQRRKDPSCDACRERKVKCDATDTSSCSECSSRSVKCQFTKETNRRMSSIKQVQDLEKQLAQAKHQVNQLRSMLQDGGAMDVDSRPVSGHKIGLSKAGPSKERLERPFPPSVNLDIVRKNMEKFGKDIFRLPGARRTPYHATASLTNAPSLPPKHVADRLLRQYRQAFHQHTPVLHWGTFIQEYEEVFETGSLGEVPAGWIAVFFAVLACGSLSLPKNGGSPNSPTVEDEGASYADITVRTLCPFADEFTMDHARAALLVGLFYTERNLRSAGSVWLATSVRMAQDLGLHQLTEDVTVLDTEMRRRVWWSVYTWDRLLSVEQGKPVLIKDEECNTEMPVPFEDTYVFRDRIVIPEPKPPTLPGMVAVYPVVKLMEKLLSSLGSSIIASSTLDEFDDQFVSIMNSLPEPLYINSTTPLDPAHLHALLLLQSTRFHLYRHNLSTLATFVQRHDALNRLFSVAQDTANYLSRTQADAPRLVACVTSVTTMHLFRCILVLSMWGAWSSALVLIKTCAATGNARKITTPCARYISFFLDFLSERPKRDQSLASLERDEEVLVYLSADMQGTDQAWIWPSSSKKPEVLVNGDRGSDSPVVNGIAHHQEGNEPSNVAALWEKIERMVSQWAEDKRRNEGASQQQQQPKSQQSPYQVPRLAPAPSHLSAPTSASVSPSPNGSSRISIANII